MENDTIRGAVPDDATAIQAIYAPIVTDTAISFEVDPPSIDEMRARVAKTVERLPWLVADNGEVIGYAYAGQHRERAAYRWSVDVSVYVASAARGRGVGRRLYERLLGDLTELGYVMAFAGITLPNSASVALHESVGFAPLGVFPTAGYKHGRWHDVGWWQRPLGDSSQPPAEPRSWDQLRTQKPRRDHASS